ncbi:hypothetical protein [Nocardioides marmotae]|uniref:Uncharacterized protein n=1 Tax=Nocardioides marmotae TaxID=2663857 RepID=A0A6I3J175_9ACTN|nr:hypothetical protein [Nocardioides marmotae]MCR6030372.1 hypothetical protein [Gordonia jinghuaiqii]MBC9734504.1 hypothetical protein [Nocardioides marmotae]MTB85604.1 hypothetical protein [Nocardioides marmotae]MTB94006.1 hypothetical protein [Nocardioides marmotae]QKE00320.1 hypothetical protein HPC71_03905 [Nocardioides marmotae]
MESIPDPELFRELERAEAAPYVDYPPTPWWYFPAAGAWFAGTTGIQGLTDDHLPLAIALLVVLLVALGVFCGWYTRYRGVMPSMFSRTPREMRRTFLVYFVGVALVFGIVWWTASAAGWPAASGVMFVLATGGLILHERSYGAAAARIRDRLS